MPVGSKSKTRWEDTAGSGFGVYILDPDTGLPSGALAEGDGMAGGFRVKLPDWHYIGGQTVTLAANTSAPVPNIPADATIFEIRARGGEVYFNINGAVASALSPGYLPEDNAEIIGPLDNLVRLALFSTTAATVAHIMWFKEA